MTTIDVQFAEKIAQLREGTLPFDDFAHWAEEIIDEKRRNGDYMIHETQTETYLSFAERSAEIQRESLEFMEAAFELILAFVEGGEEELLDEAMPPLRKAVAGFKKALELNENYMEIDCGLDGTL